MANVKVTNLPADTAPVDDDLVMTVDTSAGASKKVTLQNLFKQYVPPGTIFPYGGASAPTNYLLCDGSAVSRSTYANLFAILSTTYGSGDGSTTFNLPDLRSRVPVGKSAGDTEFDTLGETGGEKTHVLTTAELAAHTHWISSAAVDDRNFSGTGGNTQQYGLVSDAGSYSSADVNKTTGRYSLAAGSSDPHNNLQPYITLNYIVKT